MALKLLSFFITAFLLLSSGCGTSESPSTNSENNSAASASPEDNTYDPFGEIEKTPTPEKTVEAVTLKSVVTAYCEAMRKKDDAGLRKVYSAASVRSFEANMRTEGVPSLAEYLSIEPVGNKCEVVNERIQGDVGEALVSTESYPNGIMIKFVKEGGEWKMTNQSSDFDAVRKRG